MLKCAVIGNGVIAREHNDAYAQLKQEGYPLQVVACCDNRAENLKGLEPGIHTYTSIDELLEREAPDFVDICVPTFLHAQVAAKCMEAGCHVFCEKPMALTPAQCREMIDASLRTGKKLMIGQLLRFFKPLQIVKGFVESGELGRVRSAFFSRCDGRPDRPDGWLFKKENSGGVILDLHIHDVDTIHWLFGMPEGVSTAALRMEGCDVFETASSHFFYGDGKFVHAYADWAVNGNRHLSRMFRVNFEKGYVYYDKDTNVFDVVSADGKIRSMPEEGKNDCIHSEIRYFAECIRLDRPVEVCAPSSTMRTVELCRKLLASAEEGGKIQAMAD